MVIFYSVFSPTAFWLLRPLGNHAILNLSPSWKDVASIPLFFFFCSNKWPLVCLKSFNVQSICSLAHVEEMSRSIIYTCTGKWIRHGEEIDRSGVTVYLSRRFLFGLDIPLERPGETDMKPFFSSSLSSVPQYHESSNIKKKILLQTPNFMIRYSHAVRHFPNRSPPSTCVGVRIWSDVNLSQY